MSFHDPNAFLWPLSLSLLLYRYRRHESFGNKVGFGVFGKSLGGFFLAVDYKSLQNWMLGLSVVAIVAA